MSKTSRTNSSWKIGVFVVVGVLAVNAMVGLGMPKMPTTDRFLEEVETFSDLDRDDLAVAGGGCRGGWFGRSAHMNFLVSSDTGRLIHVELKRPLNLFGWRLARYSDGLDNNAKRLIGKS